MNVNGLGRIFQRGEIWWIAYYHRGTEHRESTKLRGKKGERKAGRLLKRRLGEIGSGVFIGPQEEKLTYEQMAADLVNDYQVNGKRSRGTLASVLKHLRNAFSFTRAIDISGDKARSYALQRQEDGAENASINRELAALKRMFSLAVQAGRLSRRPHIAMLEEHNARQGFVGHAEFLALRDALPDYLKDPIAFLYLSAWRVGEMRSLEWKDVDLPNRVVRLRPELSKNGKGRVLPLSGELREIIERAAERRRLDCVNVFHVDGQRIGDFRKAWQRACIASGLGHMVPTGKPAPTGKPEMRYVGLIPHDLRRSAVRNLVRAGVPETVCMALSGHKTRSVFQRYDIVSESDLTEATEKLHSHLQEQPKTSRVLPVSTGTLTNPTIGPGFDEKRTKSGQFWDSRQQAVS